jgi:hypothetical protein
MKGAEKTADQTVANLSYRVAGKVKDVYEFHRQQLLAAKWKELPGGKSVTDEYASSTFERAGFHVSLMVSPSGDAGKLDVALHNHGNVDLTKLKLPSGTTKVYVGPLTAMHVTAAPVAATAEECRKILSAEGWVPYGSAGDTVYYKKNAVQLQVTVASAPAQGGKTMISYLSEQMSSDIPAPSNAEDSRYADSLQRLSYLTAGTKDDAVRAFKEVAAKEGWKPNREETFKEDGKDIMVFRNPGGDMIWMEIKPGPGGKNYVSLRYQSSAQMAALNKKLDDQAAAYKAKMKAELAKPTIEMSLPAGATVVSQSKNEIKLKLNAGKAEALADSWNNALHETGWTLDNGTRQGGTGELNLKREGQTMKIVFDATGEIAVTSTGVAVEPK